MNIVNVNLVLNLVETLLIKCVPQPLNVRLQASVTVDSVNGAMFFDKLGANH